MKPFKLIFPTLLIALLASNAFPNTFTLVSLSGDTADLEGEDQTYDSFSTPRINENGHVAFGARFEDGAVEVDSRFDAALIYDTGILSILATTGQTTVGGETINIQDLRSVAITWGLDIMFVGSTNTDANYIITARLSGQPAAPLLKSHASSTIQPIVDFIDTLDPLRRFDLFGNLSNLNANAFSFIARLDSGNNPDATGIWVSELATNESDPPPPLRLAAIGGLPPKGGTLTIDTPIALSLNSGLEGTLLAAIDDGDEIENNNEQAVWKLATDSAATRIAKTGDSAPGSTDAFVSFGRPAIDGNSDVTFWASLMNDEEEEGLYRFSGSTLSMLTTTADPINIFGIDRSYSSFLDPVVNDAGDLAVLATDVDGVSQAILVRSAAGVWSIAVNTGMQAPGALAGVTFQSLSIPRINGAGQVAFQASLAGSGDAISDTTDSGVWALDSNGVLAQVAREGDTFEVRPGLPGTIDSVEIGGFNTAGQLALNYAFTNGANAIAIVGVEDVPPPTISQQPANTSSFDGETLVLTVDADGQGPFQYRWSKDGTDIVGATGSTLEIENASSSDDGAYRVTILTTAGSVQSQVASISIQALPSVPAFVEQPLGEIAFRGLEAVLDARAVSDTPVTYQWFFEGVAIAGKTGEVLSIQPADTDDEGDYHVVATSNGGATDSLTANILITDRRLFNISARSRIGSNANVLIAGFVINGPEAKQVLIRGIGPGLPQNLLPDYLRLPRLEIYDSGQNLIHSNDRWGDNADPDAILTAGAIVGAGNGLPPHADDTALLVDLDPGIYTAIVRSQDASTGIGLVEAFDVDAEFSRMINISARAFVGTGADVVIPGFVVEGDIPIRVLIRAVGPTLADQGVAGHLEFPAIEIFNSAQEVIASNDGWQNLWDPAEITSASALVGAFPLNEGSEDAALIMELQPGLYTVKASGENGTTGVALVEIYALP